MGDLEPQPEPTVDDLHDALAEAVRELVGLRALHRQDARIIAERDAQIAALTEERNQLQRIMQLGRYTASAPHDKVIAVRDLLGIPDPPKPPRRRKAPAETTTALPAVIPSPRKPPEAHGPDPGPPTGTRPGGVKTWQP